MLCEFLEKAGFDYAAVSKKWEAKDRIQRNSQGKYIHNTRVYGIKANYIKPEYEPGADEEGFMDIEEEQARLPFDSSNLLEIIILVRQKG